MVQLESALKHLQRSIFILRLLQSLTHKASRIYELIKRSTDIHNRVKAALTQKQLKSQASSCRRRGCSTYVPTINLFIHCVEQKKQLK